MLKYKSFISLLSLFILLSCSGEVNMSSPQGPINKFFKIAFNQEVSKRCPVVYDKKLYRISDISNSDIKFKKIFWGDSVVSDMHDLDFYSMQGEFQEIGHGGQVIACALEEVQNVINFNPDTVIIYIGGNDADGQSWYGPEEAFSYYKEIIKILAQNNITPIIHLIHEASLSRDRTYVQTLNTSLVEFAEDNNILVIPNMSELSYEVSAEMVSNNIDYKCNTDDCSPYSYDGEHLKHQGYVIWINHIKEFVPGF